MCWFTRCTVHIICTVNTLRRVAWRVHWLAFAQAMAAAGVLISPQRKYRARIRNAVHLAAEGNVISRA